MEFLNQFYTQVAAYVRSMTPGSRAVAGLLALVTMISLGYLCSGPLSGSKESLMGSQALSRDRLGAIQLALDESGLSYDVQGTQILIPQGGRSEYLAALRKAGVLSTQVNDAMDKALDDVKFYTSSKQQEARYNRAKEKRLEADIAGFAGVASAKVNLDSKRERHGLRRQTLRTASVTLEMKPGEKLSPKLGILICDHVRHSIAGMTRDDVTVFDRTNLIAYPDVCHRGGATGENHDAYRQILEHECQEKIRRLLSIPGITVIVTVQPDQNENRRTKHASFNPKNKKTTPRTVQENRDRTSEDATSTDASATVSNRPRELPGTDDEGTRESTAATSRPRVAVSIRVPGSYFEKVWRDTKAGGSRSKRPEPSELRVVEAREIERIKKLSASVLPVVEGVEDRAGLVTVVSFPDFPSPRTSRQPETPFSLAGPIVYGSILGIVALGAAGFFTFRSMMRRVPPEAPSQDVAHISEEPTEDRITRGPRDDLAGIELDGPVARRLIQRQSVTTEEPAAPPFGLLRKTDCPRIAQLLADELPQTIALVLSHLAPQQSGRVLACFAPELQVDVIRRLVDLERADPEVLREIERSLEKRLAEQVPMHERRVAGMEALGGILEAAERGVRRQILGNLAARDKQLAARFASRVEPESYALSFEDLTRLGTAALGNLCEAAGEDLLQLALVGATAEITDRLLGSLASDRAAAVRQSLDHPKPTRLSDVDVARRQLVELAGSLMATGAIPSPDTTRRMVLSATE
jgi:flagellar motor switch protein FliG